VLDAGAHDRCRRLRPQGQVLAVELVDEGVHLLLDDVGHFAYARVNSAVCSTIGVRTCW